MTITIQWQRLPLSGPNASHIWVWHLSQGQESDRLSEEWEQIDPSDLRIPFLALISQLGVTRSVVMPKKTLKTWARQTDIQYASSYPVILACQTAENKAPSSSPLPRIGELGIVMEGESLHLYTLDMIGEQGSVLCQHLQEALESQQRDTAPLLLTEEECMHAKEIAWSLTTLYWDIHQKALHPTPTRIVPDTPYILSNQVLITAALPVQAALAAFSNAQNGAKQWKTLHYLPTFTQTKEEGTTHVQVRPADIMATLDESTVEALWQQVRQLSDLHGDVLLAMIAHAIAAPQDEKGYSWIRSRDILDHRGIKPKTHEERNGRRRRAGHRIEDLRDIAACIGHMSTTWITVKQWIDEPEERELLARGKGARGTKIQRAPRNDGKVLFSQESRLINIVDFVQQFSLDFIGNATARSSKKEQPPIAIAWRYHLGSWVDPFLREPNRQLAWLLQKALNYDPYHKMWEKRLDRYFIFHMRMNAAGGGVTIERQIGQLLDEFSLPLDARNPERTRDRFEKAMNQLVADHQIDEWGYVEDPAQLPSRGWIEQWKSYTIRVYAAPLDARASLQQET